MATQDNFLGRSRLPVVMAIALLAAVIPLSVQQHRGAESAPKTSLKANRTLAAARRQVISARPLAMYYYSGDTRGLESLLAHASQMTLLAPQCYWVEKDGVVRGALPPPVAERARRRQLPVMLLLFNKGFDRETVTALLRDPKAQQRAVSYMAYLANRDNAVGFQIDFENIAPVDHKLFTQFVQRAAARLHRDGRLLSVAVVPRFSDAPPGVQRPGEPATGEWSAAFDYRALGRVADFLTLMTYDHSNRSSPAGPIAGFEWVKKALDHAIQHVPANKLLLGLPLYGREWAETDAGTTSRSLAAQDIRALLARPEVEAQWDERWRSPWFQYREAGALRTVWYEDGRSWSEKLRLVREYHLRGFAAWRLGFEDADFWSLALVKSAGQRNASTQPATGPSTLKEGAGSGTSQDAGKRRHAATSQ